SETSPAARVSRLAAFALVALAAIVFLVRLPAAIGDLDNRATVNDRQSTIGRTIQAADGLAISNDFLVQTLELLPPGATYTLQRAASVEVAQKYGISPTTMQALPDYVRFLLLPRREVAPERADYLLCYACDTSPFDARMKRLWSSPQGFVIGR